MASMPPIKIDVEMNLDLSTVVSERDLGYDSEYDVRRSEDVTMADLVAEKMATKILATAANEVREAFSYRRVGDMIDDALVKAIDEQVAAVVQRQIQPTTSYGEPKGEPISMAEYLANRIGEWLSKGQDSYSRDNTNLKRILGSTFDHALKTEMEKAVKEVRVEAADKVKREISSIVTNAVAQLTTK